jgi:hypothetical protein
MSADTLRIASRYCGPPRSGNGGYVCGRLAEYIDGPAAVRLKAPPPLDTELRVELSDGVVRLLAGDAPIAEGRTATLELAPPVAPSFAEAQASSQAYPGFARHAFPRCFGCGPQRTPGDGLCIFPGPPDDDGTVAAPWIPHAAFANGDGAVRRRYLWAALDCTGGWAVIPQQAGRAILLGEFCARIDGAVAPQERCVAIGWPIAIEGRKRFAGSAVFGASGRAVAVARATWIEVEAKSFADA